MKKIKLNKIRFSKKECFDITKAWLVLSLAFALLLGGISFFGFNLSKIFSFNFLILVFVSLLTVGLGFLLHELGHKFLAQYYGCQAEFRAFNQMLCLALLLALLVGFIFAAPGAVMISGHVLRKEYGKIALAGPLANYGLAFFFFIFSLIFPGLNFIFLKGLQINLWLGLFNLIPFWLFDGKKIFDWNKWIWILMLISGLFFYLTSQNLSLYL